MNVEPILRGLYEELAQLDFVIGEFEKLAAGYDPRVVVRAQRVSERMRRKPKPPSIAEQIAAETREADERFMEFGRAL